MYKNMYNLESKTMLLLPLSSIAIMFAKIQSENKEKQDMRPRGDY
jgi:hypothetical protein